MQSVSSRVWIRVVVSISNDNNHYTADTSFITDSKNIKGKLFTAELNSTQQEAVTLSTVEIDSDP